MPHYSILVQQKDDIILIQRVELADDATAILEAESINRRTMTITGKRPSISGDLHTTVREGPRIVKRWSGSPPPTEYRFVVESPKGASEFKKDFATDLDAAKHLQSYIENNPMTDDVRVKILQQDRLVGELRWVDDVDPDQPPS